VLKFLQSIFSNKAGVDASPPPSPTAETPPDAVLLGTGPEFV